MDNKSFRNYIVFWLSQSVSQLGSAMTGYALIVWAYKQTGSVLTVSLMSFCSFAPYIIASSVTGPLIDRYKKKTIIVLSDLAAALSSLAVLLFLLQGKLNLGHIYGVNIIIGCMNSLQSPAVSVAVNNMVPKDKYKQVSGMDSFSGNLVAVTAPMLAAFVLSVLGLEGVIFIDLISFLFAVAVLIFKVSIKEAGDKTKEQKEAYFSSLKSGYLYLMENKGLLFIMISIAFMNFFSRLTYENVLSPMLLARSGGGDIAFGIVSAVLGIGGLIGGILVSAGKTFKSNLKMIYYSAAFSFLLGDLLMGLGRNVYLWVIAGLAASIPIPFISAGQRILMYEKIPKEMLGRIFAVRNAIQYSTIPLGILLGGVLADFVFEPFMSSGNLLAAFLGSLVGKGKGSGMAVMFLITGILGTVSTLIGYHSKEVQNMENKEK